MKKTVLKILNEAWEIICANNSVDARKEAEVIKNLAVDLLQKLERHAQCLDEIGKELAAKVRMER